MLLLIKNQEMKQTHFSKVSDIMRYGMISDIHANLEALEATLRELEQHQVDHIICLGDVVGYGANPEECCQLIKSVTTHTILGNHDAAVAERLSLIHI